VTRNVIGNSKRGYAKKRKVAQRSLQNVGLGYSVSKAHIKAHFSYVDISQACKQTVKNQLRS